MTATPFVSLFAEANIARMAVRAAPAGSTAETTAIADFFAAVEKLPQQSDKIIATKQAAQSARPDSLFAHRASEAWSVLIDGVADRNLRLTYAEAALENTARGSVFDRQVQAVLATIRATPATAATRPAVPEQVPVFRHGWYHQ